MTGIAIIGAIFAFVVSFAMQESGEGLISFFLAILGLFFVDVLLWTFVVRDNQQSFALKVFFINGAIAKIFPMLSCVTSIVNPYDGLPWAFAILPQPMVSALGCSISNLCIAIIVFVAQLTFGSKGVNPPTSTLTQIVDERFEWFLIAAGVINTMFWLTLIDSSNPVLFLIARLSSSLSFAPFFAGLTANRFRRSFWFWIAILLFEIFVSYLTGTRGKAILPIVFFLTGIYISLPSRQSKLIFFATRIVPICALLGVFGTIVGIARDIVGRTDFFEAVSSGTVADRLGDTNVQEAVKDRGGYLFNISSRMTSWPPLVVPCLSPNPVEHRGFDDIGVELSALSSFRIGKADSAGEFYFANYCLKPYDFAVWVDAAGKMTSSVELSVFVDGFTRGGWGVGVVYSLFAWGLAFTIEAIWRKCLMPTYLPQYLIILVCISNINRFGNSGLVNESRLLILEPILCAATFMVISILLQHKRIYRDTEGLHQSVRS
jgi:hypothetical protein